MKFVSVLPVFLSLIIPQDCRKINDTVISQAIADLANFLSESHFMKFDIVIANNDEKLISLSEKMLKKIKIPVKVRFCTENKTYPLSSATPSIVLMHGNVWRKFKRHYNKPFDGETGITKRLMNTFHETAFIVYAIGVDRIVFTEPESFLFQLMHSSDSENDLNLVNFIFYSPDSCIPKWQPVNFFSAKSMTWRSKTFIQAYISFFKCTIGLGIYDEQTDLLESIMSSRKSKNKIIFKGIFSEILKVFAHKFDTKFHIYLMSDNPDIHYNMIFPLQLSDNIPVMTSIFHTSPPICYVHSTFLVTYGRQYDNFTKMTLPFDDFTWIALFLVFLFAFISIFTIYLFSVEIQNAVFGQGVYYPYFGVFQIFFGLGFVRVAYRNFARILFMVFTLFCLVIRTAYQGKMFDYMITEVRYPMPSTVEELLSSEIQGTRNDDQILDLLNGG